MGDEIDWFTGNRDLFYNWATISMYCGRWSNRIRKIDNPPTVIISYENRNIIENPT